MNDKLTRGVSLNDFLEPECHCDWKSKITQEEEESFKAGRNFWIYQDDYYRPGSMDFQLPKT